jgi:hypothetical protein
MDNASHTVNKTNTILHSTCINTSSCLNKITQPNIKDDKHIRHGTQGFTRSQVYEINYPQRHKSHLTIYKQTTIIDIYQFLDMQTTATRFSYN